MVSQPALGRCLSIVALLIPLATVAHAQKDAAVATSADVPVFTVIARGDPAEKSYRKMIAGMDLFEKNRAMAPKASLRFKLLPRRRDTSLRPVDLEIVGESFASALRVAEDGTFALDRIQEAWDEDASVLVNRKTLTVTWRAEIRTPGMPAGVRRLGDLRLECQVGMEAGLVSNVPGAPGAEHCNEVKPRYFFFAERPLFSVTLVHGARRQALPVEMMYANALDHPISKRELARCDCEVLLDRAYYLPLGDASWPDDTLVEYESMDERPATQVASVTGSAARNALETVALGRSTKADVRSALGTTAALRFENGFEVWAYRFVDDPKTAPKEPPRRTELAILFTPSGIASKTRLGRTDAESAD